MLLRGNWETKHDLHGMEEPLPPLEPVCFKKHPRRNSILRVGRRSWEFSVKLYFQGKHIYLCDILEKQSK